MPDPKSVVVWDLPTRLFHWTLVLLIALQFASGEFELLPMSWHYGLGYATLALIAFRILWGFFGSETSRFASFARGPSAVVRYVREIAAGRHVSIVGHNPLGGWSVLLMIACVLVQAVSGLFSSDDLTESGPLAAHVSDATVKWMTRIHHVNRYVLLLLIVLHVIAVVMHWIVRNDNLVASMWHGRKRVEAGVAPRSASAGRAIVLLAISAIAVAALVYWAG